MTCVQVVTAAALLGACHSRTGGAPATEATGSSTGPAPTPGSSTAEPGTAGSTAAESTGPAQSTSGGADESGCPAHCAKLEECADPGADGCMYWCPDAETGYRFIGDACLALYIKKLNCVSGLTCAQIEAEAEACADEQDALVSEACTVASCRDMCKKLVECGGQDDGVVCAVECSLAQTESLLEAGMECAAAIANYYACFATRPCDKLDPVQGCEAEVAATEAACG